MAETEIMRARRKRHERIVRQSYHRAYLRGYKQWQDADAPDEYLYDRLLVVNFRNGQRDAAEDRLEWPEYYEDCAGLSLPGLSIEGGAQ
jgi:hypothetical protein